MRHKHGYRKLGRTSFHRKALFKNMSIALIKSGKMETTLPKAKELRRYFEKLITIARVGDANTHRAIFASLQDKESTKKLIEDGQAIKDKLIELSGKTQQQHAQLELGNPSDDSRNMYL